MIMAAATPPKPHDEPPLAVDTATGAIPPGEVTVTAGDAPLVLPEVSLDVTVRA